MIDDQELLFVGGYSQHGYNAELVAEHMDWLDEQAADGRWEHTHAAAVASDSQTARILRVLKDGRWHSVPEIHEHVGPCRLNSRVSELRRRGYLIECRTVKAKGAARYEYRMAA